MKDEEAPAATAVLGPRGFPDGPSDGGREVETGEGGGGAVAASPESP